MNILARCYFILINYMSNIIQEVSPELSSQGIQDVAMQPQSTQVQETQNDVITPQPADSSIPTPPSFDSEENEISVSELLDWVVKTETLEQMKKSEEEILKEIWVEIDKQVWKIQEPSDTWTPNDKGDEPSHGFEKQLQELKSFTEQKIQSAREEKFKAEMLLEQTTKQHQIEKQILEEKIAKLSQDNISLKQESIPKDDETLVTYQYLRDWAKKNPDDTTFQKKLWKFHIGFAASIYWVPQEELDSFIISYHNKQKMQKDALAWWYSRTWGWVSNEHQYQNTNTKQNFNRELL